MKNIRHLLLSVLAISALTGARAHDENAHYTPPLLDGFHVSAGFGLLHYYGEIRQYKLYPVTRYMNETQAGFSFSLQKSIARAVSLEGRLLGGRLQGTNRDITLVGDVIDRGAYFNTGIFETSIGANVNFNDLVTPWVINPYRRFRVNGYTGIGFVHFDAQMYYLTTGVPAANLKKGLGRTGKTTEVVVPVGLQLSWRVSQNFDVNFDLSMRITATDKLDAWEENGSRNDKYTYTGFGVTYHFGKKRNVMKPDAEKVSHNFRTADIVKMWKAQRAYKEKNNVVALALYQELYQNNQNNAFLNYRMGLAHTQLKNKTEAISYLRKAHDLDPYVAPDIHLSLGKMFHIMEELDSAQRHYTLYRNGLSPDKIDDDAVNAYLAQVRYAREHMAAPVDVTIHNMSNAVNSQYPEYYPSVTADGKTLIFTSRRPNTTGKSIDISDHGYYEDIYVSTWNDTTKSWRPAEGIQGALNTDYHDGALSISPDGEQIFVYKNTPNRTKSGDIYVSEKGETGRWSAPMSLGKEINTSYFESSASITPDGKTLYFVSERKSGYGSGDIYKSYRDSTGVRHVENLGPVVNTSEDEIGVYIHPDGKTLYFSSRGHQSMGGYDIFRTRYENGRWSEPENLGYPINTTDDNVHFVLTTDEKRAYYSSVKDDGFGDIDIYEVDMSKYVLPGDREKQPQKPSIILSILKGKVTDVQTGQNVMAEISISDRETGAKVAHFTSNSDGEYFVTLAGDKAYSISVSNSAYLDAAEDITLPAGEDKIATQTKNFSIERKEKLPDDVTPDVFEVKNIKFEFAKGSSKLEIVEESRVELDKLIDYMKRVESFKIEVFGHTDNTGTPEFNRKLSQERAQVVGDYFRKQNISKERTIVKGFGADQPIADNSTEEGRAQNRRVIVRIVE